MSIAESNSFSGIIHRTLSKNKLPTLEEILQMYHQGWDGKNIFGRKVNDHWRHAWDEEITSKSLTKYIQVHGLANNLWKVSESRVHDMQRAEIKARLLTGTYIQQSNTARFNQNCVSLICRMCKEDGETMENLLVRCTALRSIRQENLLKLQAIAAVDISYQTIVQDNDLLAHVILDSTHAIATNRVPLVKIKLFHIEGWS